MIETEPIRHPQRPASSRLVGALACVAFAVAGFLFWRSIPSVPAHATLTAGPNITSRALIARALAEELAHRGVATELVETADTMADTMAELDAAQAREIDFAMVSGVVELGDYPELREVAPLFFEALHLLVKDELAASFDGGTLDGLRGRRVDLGPPRSATALLTGEVLRFARIPCTPAPTPTSCGAEQLELTGLLDLAARGDRKALPDAIFHLASVPSRIALALIEKHGYTLVALPFANAFRLGALLSDEAGDPLAAAVERRSTTEYWGAEEPSLVTYDRAHFKSSCGGYLLVGRIC